MRKLKTICNTLSTTNKCSRIPREGLWTNSSWFLWIRVKVLYEALVVKYKWGTQTQAKHIMDKQYEIMQGTTQAIYDMNEWMMLCTNKERERVRETMDQTQTQRYVSMFEPLALRPRLHREGFLIHYLVHRGLPPREPPPRRICTTREYRTPLSTNTTSNEAIQSPPHTRGVGPCQTTIIHLTLEG